MASVSPSTIRRALLGITDTGRPELRFAYPRTYVIRAVDAATGLLDLDPPPDATDLPPLDKVEQWTVGGALSFPAAGRAVLVTFRDALETRPVVTGFAPEAPGSRVVRVSDTGGRYAFDPGIPSTGPGPALYYSPDAGSSYVPVHLLIPGSTIGGTTPSLPSAVPGTNVVLGPGSAEVKVT